MSKWSKCWTEGCPEQPWSGLQGQTPLTLALEVYEAAKERVDYVREFYTIPHHLWQVPEEVMLLNSKKRYWVDYPIEWQSGRTPEKMDFFKAMYWNIDFSTKLPMELAPMKYAIVLPTTEKTFGYDGFNMVIDNYYPGIVYGAYSDDIARSFYNLYAYYNAMQFVADLRNYSFNPNPPFELIAPVLRPDFQYKDPLPSFKKNV